MTLRRVMVMTGLLAVVLSGSIYASYWFNHTYVGWLINDIPDAVQYRNQWQQSIDQLSVSHPAVIHYLPEGCLCRMLTIKHAQQLTEKAANNGFSVYQLNSSDTNLGEPTSLVDSSSPVSPQIIITKPSGQIAYVGAYSDGVRCNTGNSLVDAFLGSVADLPIQPVVGLDVQTCRCLN